MIPITIGTETNVWLNYAFACEYLKEDTYKDLSQENVEIGKLINYMINNPGKFGVIINDA